MVSWRHDSFAFRCARPSDKRVCLQNTDKEYFYWSTTCFVCLQKSEYKSCKIFEIFNFSKKKVSISQTCPNYLIQIAGHGATGKRDAIFRSISTIFI